MELTSEGLDERGKGSLIATAGGLDQGLENFDHVPMSGAPERRFITKPRPERPVKMSKVFFSVSVSLDGYLVPPGMDLEHAGDPAHEGWGAQWGKLHSWILPTRFFQTMLKLAEDGERGVDDQIAEQTFRRTGASIMGKRMFELGERMWPEEAPFHTPVFVLTSQVREPWVRPGGTAFYFVNDGIESALQKARAEAGERDIRVAGGANLIQQYLRAGLVDEFSLAISPVFFGGGTPLFAGVGRVDVKLVETLVSPRTTHARYIAH